MKRRLVMVVVYSVLSLAARPALATQDSGSDSSASGIAATPAPGSVDLAPAVSIAPNVSETRRFAPLLPRNTGVGRRVVYSNALQWVWLVEKDGTATRSVPVSGRRGVPATGTYKVMTQSSWSFSLDYEGVNFRWMTRFAIGPQGGNIGFHEIPRKNGEPMQTESQLGSFAGAGCIRMATADVKFLYQWAKVGTTVVVIR